jgi:REP element-mobilizing transposase RayT
MPYNPQIHHRRSIRLNNYDYTQEGAYFITICTKNKQCIFGDIKQGEMKLNLLGTIPHSADNKANLGIKNLEKIKREKIA